MPAEEILLSRYHNMDYIMNLEFEEGMEFMERAQEKELEKSAWDLYVSEYPFMTENNFRTFSEFKQNFSADIPASAFSRCRSMLKETQQTKEDLLQELNRINAAAKEMSE